MIVKSRILQDLSSIFDPKNKKIVLSRIIQDLRSIFDPKNKNDC